jgi:hypothetical protein
MRRAQHARPSIADGVSSGDDDPGGREPQGVASRLAIGMASWCETEEPRQRGELAVMCIP